MNMFLLTILVFFIGILIGFHLSKLFKKSDENVIIPINIETLETNKQLVDTFINKYFNETLFYYLNKEITFDDNSIVKIQAKFKYRDCIRNLMRPNVYYANLPFKNVFIQRIYFNFISQTPKNIKNLIFSFESGFTVDNYWEKKKKPSIQPYIIDYIDKKINKCFLEITRDEEIAFKSTNIDSVEIDKLANEIDSREYAKLCLFIYNLDDEVSEDSVKTKENVIESSEKSNNIKENKK